MSEIRESSGSSGPRGFRRVAPAMVLFWLSPFVAEMLLGDISIDAIWVMLVVAPLYGGGALIVREMARRLGRGWPTILFLALAYGILEEGIVIQTLFNPNYLGLHLLRHGYVAALGMSAWWTPFVLSLHTFWSIAVPIAVVEALFAERRTQPWLGKAGLGIAAIVMVAGAVLMHAGTRRQDAFSASNRQLVSAWSAVGTLIVLAVRYPLKVAGSRRRPARVSVVALIALTWGIAFMSAPRLLQNWALAAMQWALAATAVVLLIVVPRRIAWTALHTLAAAGGAMLAYAFHAFIQDPVVGSKGTIDLMGNTVFAFIALVLFALAVKKERSFAAAPHAQ